MGTALLNTLMGMGTVFVVLIFICWLISLFKFIPSLEAKLKKQPLEPTPIAPAKPAPIIEEEEEEELVDDGELVAVITAALYASLSEKEVPVSADGLVVRSIKRARR